MFEEWALKKIANEVYSIAKQYILNKKWSLDFAPEILDRAYGTHSKTIANWSREVSFLELNEARRTSEIYVNLDLFTMPRKRTYKNEKKQKEPLIEFLSKSTTNVILLGQPGAGKTTSMKKLCYSIFTEDKNEPNEQNTPVLIRLRELNQERQEQKYDIFDHLFLLFGLKIYITKDSLSGEEEKEIDVNSKKLKKETVISILENINALLIIDGFDELNNEVFRQRVISDVRDICLSANASRLILTSRTGDFDYHIDNCYQYEISNLSKEQINEFAHKWLVDKSKAENFVSAIYATPYADTALRPLTLSHLCAIYIRTGSIPQKPKFIYKKVISILLEEWDEQRSVTRRTRYTDNASEYGGFEKERKIEFLSHLSYELTMRFKTTVFNTEMLIETYKKICSDYHLTEEDSKPVISEIESHTGLLIQTGVEQFEFTHKSLQEYLCADYIVKLPTIPYSSEGLLEHPDELAICVAISSRSSEYFVELILRRIVANPKHSFLRPFIARLDLEKPEFRQTELFVISVYYIFTILSESNSTFLNIAEKNFFADCLDEHSHSLLKKYYREGNSSKKHHKINLKKNQNSIDGYSLPSELIVPKFTKLVVEVENNLDQI